MTSASVSTKIAIAVLAAAAAITVAGCSSSGGAAGTSQSSDTPTVVTTVPSVQTPSPKVSRGLGLKDASADVTLGKLKNDGFGLGEVGVVVVNHSSKRSNYVIDVAIESADGKEQYGTGSALVTDLDPGQRTRTTATMTGLPKHVPAAAKIILKTVQRNEAF